MSPARLSVIVTACAVAVVSGQGPQEPPRFRVAVDVVSIDAVVTDRNGATVRDLTAADFEIFQDGKRQKVISAQFVPVAAPAGSVPASRTPQTPARAAMPPVPAAPVAREQVQRTIVIVVDDLGLSFEGMNRVRQALHAFVDTGLLPADLTAIMRTGEARSLVQPLTTDRAALHAAIDALRYNTLSRKGVSGLADIVQVGGNLPEFIEAGELRQLPSIMGALAALTLVVQSARDLPGRRAVIFASEGFPLGAPDALPPPEGEKIFDTTRVREAVDHVIDQATRAGVVIYTVDGQGLQSGGFQAADDIHSAIWDTDPMKSPERDAVQGMVRQMAAKRTASLISDQQSLVYLSEQTGGFGVLNTNDPTTGLGRISRDLRDYYIIGYQPDADTFKRTVKRVPVHSVEVKVRRDGLRVRSRKQFVGVSDPPRSSAPLTPAQQLVQAAMSPFSTTAIAVTGTPFPGYTAGQGSFVRLALRLDARALSFSGNPDGSRTATVDLVTVVLDSNGIRVDNTATGFDVTLGDNEAGEQVMRDGLVYTTRVPIKTPGGYQLRYAVRDRRSGAIGSGGGFVDIPDVAGGAFALSGLVLGRAAPANEPPDKEDLRPGDGVPAYASGTSVSYSCEIYNAGKSVQTVVNLWRGTEKVVSLPPWTLAPPAGGGPFAASGTVTLAGDLPAGTYMLQLAATSDDPKDAKRTRSAVQWRTLEVSAASSHGARNLY